MASALEILRNVTTGTITTMLLKKGIRRSWMAGAMPFGFSGKRVVGPAFTLRFVPVREDLATPESWSKPISTRGAIEAMLPDDFLSMFRYVREKAYEGKSFRDYLKSRPS